MASPDILRCYIHCCARALYDARSSVEHGVSNLRQTGRY